MRPAYDELDGLNDLELRGGIPVYRLKHPWWRYAQMFADARQRQLQAQVADFKLWLEEHYPDDPETDPYEAQGIGPWMRPGEDGELEAVVDEDRHGKWLADAERRRPELFDRSLGWPGARADAQYFASGSNNEGEIRALALLGIHPGVAVDQLDRRDAAFNRLVKLRGLPIKIFVDSGAFSEIDFKASPPCADDRAPPPCIRLKDGKSLYIDDAEWRRRLLIYKRLARELGPQLYLVSPDMVGHQLHTLDRIQRFRDEVREVASLGANVILPLQNPGRDNPHGPKMQAMWDVMRELLGDVTGAWRSARATYLKRYNVDEQASAVYREAREVWEAAGRPRGPDGWRTREYQQKHRAVYLRHRGGAAWARAEDFEAPAEPAPTSPWVAGVPLKAGAAKHEDVWEFIAQARPERVHLLGFGRTNDHYDRVMGGIQLLLRQIGHTMALTHDSVRLAALAARDGETPRVGTAMRDALVAAGRDPGDRKRPGAVAKLKFETWTRVFLNEQLERLDDAVDAGWQGHDYVYYDGEFF